MDENCYVCGKKGQIKHLNRNICKKCFVRNVEKRVKKHLGRSLFRKGDKILVVGEVERILLENAVKGMPVEIVFRKVVPKSLRGYRYVIVGKTMDEIDEEFLEGLFKRKLVLGELKKKFFNILEPLTDEEVKEYAKVKKVEFKAKKEKMFLDSLGMKELKYNLYKNIRALREKL